VSWSCSWVCGSGVSGWWLVNSVLAQKAEGKEGGGLGVGDWALKRRLATVLVGLRVMMNGQHCTVIC
jgi:hypothetical protein